VSGNYLSGPSKITPAIATANQVDLVPPDYLDASLIPIFKAIASEVPAGLARPSDVRLIVQLCQAMHMQDETWAKLMEDGLLTVDKTHGGEQRKHPAFAMWRQATDMARQCMNLLGMSPAARARIQEPGISDHDPFEGYLRRRRQPGPDA
jgi:P27 family predicted phage terminase small subunit